VFADHGIVLFHFELVGGGSLVLVRGIEMAGTRGRIHSDFLSHRFSPLNLFTASANIGQHLFDAVFVDDPHALTRYAQGHKTFLGLQPKPMLVQVRQKTAAGPILCM
jgi:hypothetical protein